MHPHQLVCSICFTIILWGIGAVNAQAEPPVIAAASDLQFALEDVAEAFEEETGQSLRLNFGSSGNFRRQIAQGAPFELYLAADEEYALALHREGYTVDEGTLYAIGRVVVIAPTGDPAGIVDGSLEKLRERLDEGKVSRLAIANPDHAPYGVAAMEALRSKGIWEQIQPHLVFGENVSQAARMALSGDTEGGFVAYSLALAPPVKARSEYDVVPQEAHKPQRQRMVLIKGASETARMFYEYLQREPARDIFTEYGFMLPDDN